jgi:serine protease Do
MTIQPVSRILLTGIMLALAAAGGPAVWGKDKAADHPPLKLDVDTAPIDRDAELRVSYASIVRKASPTIVYVKSSKKVRNEMPQFFNDPMFHHFFGVPGQGGIPQNRLEQSLGSGIIVSPDGYVITNDHVVDGADDIQVSFGKPEKEFKAAIIGRDKEADIAVLKIDATDLPAATLGDSEQLQVGDTVLAIGNPFGVGLTVTHGIVSALGRNNLNIESFEDFIQTDAPINPGNSGGALLDSKGRVVGINTAIVSGNGGSNGIGFAIPINLVRSVVDQLVRNGKVARGFMGVGLEEIKPDLAEQFGTTHGALVTDVNPDTPAEKAGLKSGDVITKLDGKPVDDPASLRLAVSEMAPGTSINLEYLRDGKSSTVTLKLADRSSSSLAQNDRNGAEGKNEGVLNGVTVGDITPEIREQLGIPPGSNIRGAVITDVDPDSASAKQGLSKGDIVMDLNRRPVHNADEAVKLSDEIKGPKVLVRVWRGGSSRYIVVDESQ